MQLTNCNVTVQTKETARALGSMECYAGDGIEDSREMVLKAIAQNFTGVEND